MKEGFPKDTTRKSASVQKEEKVEIAMKMHMEGYNGQEIANKLGVTRQCIHSYIKGELTKAVERRVDLGDTIVENELSRLEAVIKLCMRDLEKQVIEWIDDDESGEKVPSTTDRIDNYVAATLMKAIDQKAKLLGLNKPQQIEHKHEITTIEDLVVQSRPLEIIDVEATVTVPNPQPLVIDEEGVEVDD